MPNNLFAEVDYTQAAKGVDDLSQKLVYVVASSEQMLLALELRQRNAFEVQQALLFAINLRISATDNEIRKTSTLLYKIIQTKEDAKDGVQKLGVDLDQLGQELVAHRKRSDEATIKLGNVIGGLGKLNEEIEKTSNKIQATRMNWWRMAHQFIHLGDQLMDNTVEGWQETMGSIIAGVGDAITIAHAAIVTMAAEGNYLQAALIMGSILMQEQARGQAIANLAAMNANRDYISEIEDNNMPW